MLQSQTPCIYACYAEHPPPHVTLYIQKVQTLTCNVKCTETMSGKDIS